VSHFAQDEKAFHVSKRATAKADPYGMTTKETSNDNGAMRQATPSRDDNSAELRRKSIQADAKLLERF
jgi:hypothetical protein